MAFNYKIASLPKSDQDALNGLSNLYPGLADYVEKNGTLPSGIPSDIAQSLNQVISRLPTQTQAYQNYINSQKDESNLSSDELQNRLEAYQNLSSATGKNGQIDTAALRDEISKYVHSGEPFRDLPVASKEQLIEKQLQNILTTGNIQKADIFGNVGTQDQKFKLLSSIFTPDHINDFRKAQPLASSDDVARIQGLIGTRNQYAQNEKDVNNYISQLPDALSANREQFLAGQTQNAVDQFGQQYVPDALQNLNARGALFSGDVGDVLSSGAAQTAAQLDAQRAALEQQDNQFYFNAAYSNQVRQILNSNQNVQEYLANERNRVLTGQQQQFTSSQNDLNNNLNSQLTQANYDRQLTVQQANLKRQQDLAGQQRTQGLYSQLGGVIGGIGGAALTGGSPVGYGIGSQLGQSVVPQTQSDKTIG